MPGGGADVRPRHARRTEPILLRASSLSTMKWAIGTYAVPRHAQHWPYSLQKRHRAAQQPVPRRRHQRVGEGHRVVVLPVLSERL